MLSKSYKSKPVPSQSPTKRPNLRDKNSRSKSSLTKSRKRNKNSRPRLKIRSELRQKGNTRKPRPSSIRKRRSKG